MMGYLVGLAHGIILAWAVYSWGEYQRYIKERDAWWESRGGWHD